MSLTTYDVYQALIDLRGHEDPLDDYSIRDVEILADNLIAITYSRREIDYLLGVRVRVRFDRDDEIARIVAGELGEPVGSGVDRLEFDANGVGWRDEDPPEWWYSQPTPPTAQP